MRAKRRVALASTLVVVLASSLAFGEDPTPCYEAYWTSGLAQQQMGFDEFLELHSDGVCAAGGPGR